ncbi:hypothetical protein [Kribbella italica]|uniref:Uncharacterized protein n=1 Tax=Kribbella italica TaxID=1540520 RepID=A0A7W9MXJ0_9ACTN|nr:hypothetical protein [Kribbella italica]MBB5840196.1 hypothetical protein [Kribbella italica]
MSNASNWLNRITGRRGRYTPPPTRTDGTAEMNRRIELAKYWEADYQARLVEAQAHADESVQIATDTDTDTDTAQAVGYDRFATAYDWIDAGAPDLGHGDFIRRLAAQADALVAVGDLDMAYQLRTAADRLGEQARDDEWSAVVDAIHADDRAAFIEQQRGAVQARVERFLARRGLQLPPDEAAEEPAGVEHDSYYEAGRRMQRERGAERAVQHAYEMRMALAEENSETTSTWLGLDSLYNELEGQARQSGLTPYSRDEIEAAMRRLARDGADDGSRFHLVTDDTTGRTELMFDDPADHLAEADELAAASEVPPVTAALDQPAPVAAGPDLGHDRVAEHLREMAAAAQASGEAGEADRLRLFAETVQRQAASDEYIAAQLAAGSDQPEAQIEDAREEFRRWIESTSRGHGIDVPADLTGPDNTHNTEIADSSDQLTESAADDADADAADADAMIEPCDRLADGIADQDDDEQRQELDAELEAAEYNDPRRRDEALAREVDELAASAESSGDVERAGRLRIVASETRHVPYDWDGESAIAAEPWQIEASEAAVETAIQVEADQPSPDERARPVRGEADEEQNQEHNDAHAGDTREQPDALGDVRAAVETSACTVAVTRAQLAAQRVQERVEADQRQAASDRDDELARWHADDQAAEHDNGKAIEHAEPSLGDQQEV